MLQHAAHPYGLTTEDAMRAYRDGRLADLPANNRWRFALVDHADGLHRRSPDAFVRICLACRQHRDRPAGS